MKLPGTDVNSSVTDAEVLIENLFCMGNISLSQLSLITGVPTTSVQNWVNRGWLPHPVNKKYTKDHAARLFIINVMKKAVSLEQIAKLLFFLNGDADDKSDDAISETEFYVRFCRIVSSDGFNAEHIDETIVNALDDLPSAVVRQKVAFAMAAVARAYLASRLIEETEKIYESMSSENKD